VLAVEVALLVVEGEAVVVVLEVGASGPHT